jgi:hypothetical protein
LNAFSVYLEFKNPLPRDCPKENKNPLKALIETLRKLPGIGNAAISSANDEIHGIQLWLWLT